MINKANASRILFIVFVLLSFLFSCSLMLNGLHRGISKDFWSDEVFEIVGPLRDSTWIQLRKGVYGSPSNNPLHYVLEKHVVGNILKKEIDEKKGWDWNVSLRLFPTFVLALGSFLTTLLLFEILGWVSLLIPLTLLSIPFVELYSAETRIYATWMAMSLVFYALSIRLVDSPEKFWVRLWWFGFAEGLTMTLNTAVIQVFSCAFVVMVTIYFTKKLTGSFLKFWLGTMILNVLIFMFYDRQIAWERGNWMPLSEMGKNLPDLGSLINTFSQPMIMDSNATWTLSILGVILAVSVGIPQGRKRNFLVFSAGMLFFQMMCAAVIFFAHIFHAYPIFGRHLAFLSSVYSLALPLYIVFLAFVFKSLVDVYFKNFRHSGIITEIIVAVLFFSLLPSNVYEKLYAAPEQWRKIQTMYRPTYCHGPVWLEPNEFADFNAVNRARHSGRCGVPTDGRKYQVYDKELPWIDNYEFSLIK